MTEVARAAQPLPSAQTFRQGIAAERSKTFGHDEAHPAFAAYKSELLKQYGVQRVQDLPVNFRGLALRRDDEMGYAIYDRQFAALEAVVDRQDLVRMAPGGLLPLLALQPVSMALAGTDTLHHRHFARAAEAHRRIIQTLASEDLIRNARYGDTGYVAPAALWARVPAFDYRVPGVGWALGAAAPALGGLLLWLLLTIALAAWAARRVKAV